MWGQGQLKVQDMNLWDPGEKMCKFQSCYFCRKKHCVDAELYGEFNDAIFIFSMLYIVVKKINLKILYMDIFKAFGRYENHFQTD